MDDEVISPEDSTRWLAALRAAYARSLEEGSEHWSRAQAAVTSGAVPAAALAEAALLALETMGPDDPTSLGMSACDALRLHGIEAQLDRLRRVRPVLPARTGLRDWRVEASRALEVIEARVSGTCTCAAEAAAKAGVYGEQWRIEDETVDAEHYCVRMKVRCTHCESLWSVRREDGYHYPLFAWSRA